MEMDDAALLADVPDAQADPARDESPSKRAKKVSEAMGTADLHGFPCCTPAHAHPGESHIHHVNWSVGKASVVSKPASVRPCPPTKKTVKKVYGTFVNTNPGLYLWRALQGALRSSPMCSGARCCSRPCDGTGPFTTDQRIARVEASARARPRGMLAHAATPRCDLHSMATERHAWLGATTRYDDLRAGKAVRGRY